MLQVYEVLQIYEVLASCSHKKIDHWSRSQK